MDISAIAATSGLSLLPQSATGFAAHVPGANGASSAFQQHGINLNGLSINPEDTMLDGVRATLTSLISKEKQLKATGYGDRAAGVDVSVVNPEVVTVGDDPRADLDKGVDDALTNLRDVYEFATNMALVTNVVGNIGRGIMTLTTRGG